MSEDQWDAIIGPRQLARVGAEGRDPAAGVHDHRQPALLCERQDPADSRIARRKALGPGVQLDPGRPSGDRPLRLLNTACVWIDAAERHQPPAAVLRCGEHAVVSGTIGTRLREREHDGPRVDDLSALSNSSA